MSAAPQSPGPNSAMQFDTDPPADQQIPQAPRKPYFFREEYAGLIVKGNFMTLAAKPVHVEEGEWLAHQGNYGEICQVKDANSRFQSGGTVQASRWNDSDHQSNKPEHEAINL